ncbi:VOC family protein [Radiobacillus deserti]|uniref:VOC domain-containing protein n=1 Tax=Radiobacillus deserti TaxID=2594883 RepID=A0A516KDA2_9BACI|nr:VOC family protein [Radiobacillus deserti]QDP39392.1 hypothetical protein FN924_03805 [Radiobacillus deserti]
MTATKNPIHSTVGSIFIHVKDMERAVRWYSKLLGINISHPSSNKVIPVTLDNLVLLLDAHRAETFEASIQPLFSLTTKDIDKTIEFLKEMNVEVVGEVERFPDISFVTIKDSEGNSLLVVQE